MLQCPRWSNVARSSPLALNKPPRGRQRPDVAGSRGRHGNVLGALSVSEMRSDGQARMGHCSYRHKCHSGQLVMALTLHGLVASVAVLHRKSALPRAPPPTLVRPLQKRPLCHAAPPSSPGVKQLENNHLLHLPCPHGGDVPIAPGPGRCARSTTTHVPCVLTCTQGRWSTNKMTPPQLLSPRCATASLDIALPRLI